VFAEPGPRDLARANPRDVGELRRISEIVHQRGFGDGGEVARDDGTPRRDTRAVDTRIGEGQTPGSGTGDMRQPAPVVSAIGIGLGDQHITSANAEQRWITVVTRCSAARRALYSFLLVLRSVWQEPRLCIDGNDETGGLSKHGSPRYAGQLVAEGHAVVRHANHHVERLTPGVLQRVPGFGEIRGAIEALAGRHAVPLGQLSRLRPDKLHVVSEIGIDGAKTEDFIHQRRALRVGDRKDWLTAVAEDQRRQRRAGEGRCGD
jgi:hypothetical protein